MSPAVGVALGVCLYLVDRVSQTDFEEFDAHTRGLKPHLREPEPEPAPEPDVFKRALISQTDSAYRAFSYKPYETSQTDFTHARTKNVPESIKEAARAEAFDAPSFGRFGASGRAKPL